MMRLLIVLLAWQGWAAGAESITGHARKDGKELYTEKTQIERENGRDKSTKTEYFSPEGKRLAELKATFTRDPYVAEIDFNDFRDGYAYTVRFVDDHTVEIREKESSTDPWKTLPRVKIKKDMILIQSTTAFARAHIEEIRAGKKIEGRFLIPSSADSYSMQIVLAPSVRQPAENLKVSDIKIESGNWLLRHTFFPPFTLTYDFERQKVLKYIGVSNIMDELGIIEITYD